MASPPLSHDTHWVLKVFLLFPWLFCCPISSLVVADTSLALLGTESILLFPDSPQSHPVWGQLLISHLTL